MAARRRFGAVPVGVQCACSAAAGRAAYARKRVGRFIAQRAFAAQL
jgi:hypothetical protein